MPQGRKRWWQTLPGAIATITGLLTALAGLILAIQQLVSLFRTKDADHSDVSKKDTSHQIDPDGPIDKPHDTNVIVDDKQKKVHETSKKVDPAPQLPTPPPKISAPSAPVRAGQEMYSITSIDTQRTSTAAPGGAPATLRIVMNVRVANEGPESIMFSDSGFRLIVDGAPLAPVKAPSQFIARDSSADGVVEFEIPESTKRLELRVGWGPTKSTVPLNISRT
jgi:hypothetical protein